MAIWNWLRRSRDGVAPQDPDHPRDGTVVLGAEIARARATEADHRLGHLDPSPLDGISYEGNRGEYVLFRFVPSERDEQIRRFLAETEELAPDARGAVRDRLTMDDFYTLMTFARRSVLVALRTQDQDAARAGATALSMVDVDRVDSRDATWAAALTAYAAQRVGADEALPLAASRSTAAVSEILLRFAAEKVVDLSVWGFREVLTSDGPVLLDEHGGPFNPTHDLVSIGYGIVAALGEDRWRATNVGIGSDLPPVWLTQGDPEDREEARSRIRGCVQISAALSTRESTDVSSQHLLAFVAEAGMPQDAEVLVHALGSGIESHFAAIGVALGSLCVLMISRSYVLGVESYETVESLRRFRSVLVSILAEHARVPPPGSHDE